MNTHMNTQTESDLVSGYGPSTFPVMPIALPSRNELSAKWANGIQACNALTNFMVDLEAKAVDAARAHLMATLSLGCILSRMCQAASKDGIAITSLFAGYKGNPKAREAALKVTGGVAFRISYATGNKYMKLYRDHAKRIAEDMTPEGAARLLADHASSLMAGAYSDPQAEIENLWQPYVSADNLRQAYLDLAPNRPASNLDKELDKAAAAGGGAEQVFASWEDQREKLCADFGGLFTTLDTYILHSSMFVTATDREAQARRLEEAAARLRGQKTQPDLPGIAPATK